MNRFRLSSAPLDTAALRAELADPGCGGFVAFEGWVRDHNEGQRVTRLEYEAFAPLCLREGTRVIAEATDRFGLRGALCAHRVGTLELGDIAVWVGVATPHRDEAFCACRYIIDEVKHRLPIWKKEHYASGDSGWVNCERCAVAVPDADDRARTHDHAHAHGQEHGPRR
jgi:molybdopterin synthase catalytic subunit